MKNINGVILTSEECIYFIEWWNDHISEYGLVFLSDVKYYLGVMANEIKYVDNCYGWTDYISTNDFIRHDNFWNITFETNLPEYKLFDEYKPETQR